MTCCNNNEGDQQPPGGRARAPTMELIVMRRPCSTCGDTKGRIETKSGQDVVRCNQCDAYQYCAPHSETGKPQRKVGRSPVPPSIRWSVMERARGRCEACGTSDSPSFHVAHLLSYDDGKAEGFTEAQLLDLENLAWFCEECNLGNLRGSVHPVFWLALVKRRARC